MTATIDQTTAASDGVTPSVPVGDFEPVQTVGRRKTAIVRIRVTPGTGKFVLDKKGVRKLEDVFDKVQCQLIQQPFELTGTTGSFDVRATLTGGGTSGQAGAMVLAIARALCKVNSEWRRLLKKAGLLTRDPRAKERKKAGLKKARKAPQYSKR